MGFFDVQTFSTSKQHHFIVAGTITLRKSKNKLLIAFFAGQLNDTQQELKENNELVVELQGNVIDDGCYCMYSASCHVD